MVQSPVMVKIARPDSIIGRSPLLEMAPSPAPSSTLDPCAKETVLSALRESRKRAVEEEEDDQNFPSAQENKRRRHESNGSGQSAFERLVANGAPASLVPKPGSLKRSLFPSHCLDDGSSKRSRTSSLSSVNSLSVGGIHSTLRNAIASSYSSTRGLAQLWKRRGPSTTPLSSPASSRSQTPERPNKKARYPNSSLTEEESHKCSSSTPVKADKEVQAEKTETPLQSGCGSLGTRSSSGNKGKRKRRIQLLSTHRGNHCTLPPPPQLGYSVTSEDLDAEKKASLQWFNKVLEENTEPSPSSPVETPSEPTASAFTLMSAKPAPALLAVTTAGSNPLLESLKKMQEGQSCAGQAEPSAAAAVSPWLPVLPVSLDVGSSVPVSSPEAAQPLAAAPAPSSSAAQPVSGTSGLMAPSSELGQTPARLSSTPKPSILFGILTSPLASQPTAVTAAPAASVPSTTPVFKPVFGSLAKGEGPSFPPASGQGASAVAPSSEVAPSLGPPGVAPSNTFKPIFASLPPPATATVSSSPFAPRQTLQPSVALSLPAGTTASVSGFSVATSGLMPATASVTTVSASKPVFSFGPGLPTSTAVPSSTSSVPTPAAAASPAAVVTTLAPQQPLLFGAPPSASTATAPRFLFGQLGAVSGPSLSPLTSSAFGQAAAATTTTATSESAPGAEAATAVATTSTAGFSLFDGGSRLTSEASSAPSATAQSPLTFGSGNSAFGGGFGAAAAAKRPPPYTAASSQPAFAAGLPEGPKPTVKPAAAGPVAFGTPFNFRGDRSGAAAQPAFGRATQTPFGEPGPLASFSAKSQTASQPAFGAAAPGFSFGTVTTAGFGSSTQTTSSGGGAQGSLVFGGPAPFAFGAGSQPAAAGSAFGIGGAAAGGTGPGAPPVGFSFGGGPSGTAGAATPFGASLAQTPLGAQSQSSGFAFNIPSVSESKLAFGGALTPTFGQSAPAPGGGTLGGCTLSFGTPVTLAFGGGAAVGPSFGPPAPAFSAPPLGPPAPAFSIGAGTKMGARQRLQARRQHTRKK